MFEILTYATMAIVALGILYAYDGSRDVFHPMVLSGPILIFLYGWMPLKLLKTGQLTEFFNPQQLIFVQGVVLLGVIAFVLGCLSIGCQAVRYNADYITPAASAAITRSAIVMGAVGYIAWFAGVVNAGGLQEAFSKPYGGGWDESGYVKDASMLLFSAILLIYAATRGGRLTTMHRSLILFFAAPWALQALLAARRGPTFLVAVMVGMGWYLHQGKRPPLLGMALGGVAIGYLILFLVVNRDHIYLGGDFEVTTEVSSYVDTPHSGNEYIYGAGAMLSYRAKQNYYWGKRYLAQVLVRPIPSSVWPTKYEDTGLGFLRTNAGTAEGFAEVLGWEGAPGSAPGMVADLWIEFSWLCIPVIFIIARLYARCWRNAVEIGEVWRAQYVIAASLSLYLVMQTMEAVIFRLLILSVPVWIVWRRARRQFAEQEGPQLVDQSLMSVS